MIIKPWNGPNIDRRFEHCHIMGTRSFYDLSSDGCFTTKQRCVCRCACCSARATYTYPHTLGNSPFEAGSRSTWSGPPNPHKPLYILPERRRSLSSMYVDSTLNKITRNFRTTISRLIRTCGFKKDTQESESNSSHAHSLPAGVSEDRSEIEYLRRIQRESLMSKASR